jgi:glucose/arabinose dehydrogenase
MNCRVMWGATATLAVCASACNFPMEPDPDEPGAGCEDDNGGISLLPGFCASTVADDVGLARHMAVTPSGDLYVALLDAFDGSSVGGILALHDDDDDGHADVEDKFFEGGGSGIYWRDDTLWFGQADQILRFDLPDGTLVPAGEPEVVVSGLPADGDHTTKSIVVDDVGNLFVNIGSATNSCQVVNRELESPGIDPCPELDVRAGLWQFDAYGTNLVQTDGVRWVTGLRNAVALSINPTDGQLVAVQHGRDELHDDWPAIYPNVIDEAALPAEELFLVSQNADYGWPYCYYDPVLGKVLAPEYGGDGETVGTCSAAAQPSTIFPAHWAPNAIHFHEDGQFPSQFDDGAFVAFHGSHHPAAQLGELPGYQIAYVDFDSGAPVDDGMLKFAWDFAGPGRPLPEAAVHRPTGFASGPDGSLYVSDDQGGRIWRIFYTADSADWD